MNSIDYENLYTKLYACTDYMLGNLKSYSKVDKAMVKGKEIHDYVSDALANFLENQEKYDDTKRGLKNYICFHIIKTLVSNDVRSAENRSKSALVLNQDSNDDNSKNLMELIIPSLEPAFDNQIDYKKILEYIETLISQDKDVETMYMEHYIAGLKRRKIMSKLDWNSKKYAQVYRDLHKIIKANTELYKKAVL